VALFGVFYLKNISLEGNFADYAIALVASLLAGLAYTCINILKETEHPLVIMLYFPLITLVIMAPYTLSHWQPPSFTQWMLLLLMGTFIQIAQYFVTLAYQRGEPGRIGPVYYIEIILSCFWGYIFFAENLTPNQFIGIGLILFSLLLNSRLKKVSR
jgi:drug/metabolite transporter (DMT)-like permease